jgi:hypothetical protein
MICKVQKEKISLPGKNKNQKELIKQLFLVSLIYQFLTKKRIINSSNHNTLNSLPKNKFRKTEFTSFFLHLKNNNK